MIHEKIKFEVQIIIYLGTDEQVQEELVNGMKCFIFIHWIGHWILLSQEEY